MRKLIKDMWTECREHVIEFPFEIICGVDHRESESWTITYRQENSMLEGDLITAVYGHIDGQHMTLLEASRISVSCPRLIDRYRVYRKHGCGMIEAAWRAI